MSKSEKFNKMQFDTLLQLFEQTQTELRNQAAKSIDIALVVRNWLFGWYIVEFEHGNAKRTELYGKGLIDSLSIRLNQSGIKGVSPTNLRKFREFYLAYSKIQQTLPVTSLEGNFLPLASNELQKKETAYRKSIEGNNFVLKLSEIWQKLSFKFKLSWSHYITLFTITSIEERNFYELESIDNNWSIRELKRQIAASLYERLALSRDKTKAKELSEKGQTVSSADDIIKSPYILEFLNLPEHPNYSEHEFETAIINKIEHFLLELGKGFLFEARQKRFTFDDDHFYVDLVFYNRLLRCYVLIDLKKDKLTHQDIGQMQMYVNFFDRFIKKDYESPTIGILLCHRKNDALVELTLPKDANIHASEYKLYLPSKEEFKKQLEEAQKELKSNNNF